MSRFYKYATAILLILLTSVIFASAIAQDEETPPPEEIPIRPIPFPPDQIPAPPPEGSALVIISSTVGGITDPTPGNRYYDNGTIVTLTATPYVGFSFVNWVVKGFYLANVGAPPILISDFDAEGNPIIPSSSETFTTTEPISVNMVLPQNPLTFDCGYGYVFTYQAVFAPNPGSTGSPDIATLVIKSSVGGQVTPGEGTYTFNQGSSKTLTATPDNGFEFQYWIISGAYFPGHGVPTESLDSTTVTTNPLVVNCGVGYSYTYQPIFTPTGAVTAGGGGTPVEYFYIIIAVLAIIAIVAVAFAVMKRGNK